MSAEEKYLLPQTSSPPPAGDSLEKYLVPQQAKNPLSRVTLPAPPAPDYEKYLKPLPQQTASPTPQPVPDAGGYESI
jgi:hypothetical protein